MSADDRNRGFLPDAGDLAWRRAPLQTSGAAASAVSEVFISYPAGDKVLTECELRIVSPAPLERPHLVLMADSQNGKHAIVRWIARRHRPFRLCSADLPVVPVAVTELPLQANDENLRDALSQALGLIASSSWSDLAVAYREATVRLLFLRNTHELAQLVPSAQRAALARLMDFAREANIRLVFVATQQFQGLCVKHQEALASAHRVSLPRWTEDALALFLAALQAVWNVPGLELPKYADMLCEAGNGRIGLVVRCLRYALDEGRVRDAQTFLQRLLSSKALG